MGSFTLYRMLSLFIASGNTEKNVYIFAAGDCVFQVEQSLNHSLIFNKEIKPQWPQQQQQQTNSSVAAKVKKSRVEKLNLLRPLAFWDLQP